ncbi:hypothetical protein DSOL_0103 [Desulfosporosinus metallidurans]|uniref:RsgI N-terminal anti-sigma domain-containing protein n=2 Tax=Desulfosporosinus metallidurans TaxID=1888891 RepID=A0A1Q8R2T6_9FIRM|nr:hypothetical protein DSOL_0103 [Desulfosporosinus metallidurans]
MKAVVLEKNGSQYTVLGENGTFRQVYRRQDAEVGEEIEIRTGIEIFSGLRVWAGAAAVFLLVLTALLGWNLYQAPTAVALLSVDINPSLQFTIDAQGHLLKLQTQNEDAKRMLSQIDLTGKSLDQVLEQVVNQAVKQKFLDSEQQWVVVGYSPMTNKTEEQMPKELNKNQIIAWVTEKVEKQGFTPQVAVFTLTPQERELAQKGELTLGEYALWQAAQKAGVVTRPEMLKETSERVRLLDNPQVQAKIKEEQKENESGLSSMHGTSKQDLGTVDNPKPSPVKDPNPRIEKGMRQGQDEVKNVQKNQEKNHEINQKNNQKNNQENNQENNQVKEHGQTQSKELDQTKSSVYKETETSILENKGHDASRNSEISKNQDDEGKNGESGRDEHQNR